MMRGPHPIASAFFDAHDVELLTATSLATTSSATELPPPGRSRTMVARARGSLGWRTRYSSSSVYPVSILPVEGRRIGREEVEGGASASYNVRQVFPGGSGGGRSSSREGCDVGDVFDSRPPPPPRDDDDDDDDHDDDENDASVGEDDCELGTGATVWPGSIVLLKYLERMAHDPDRENVLMGKTVADLGSGTAIASIASALLGADVVVCTDGCDPVVDLACANIHDAIATLGREGEACRPMHRRCSFRGCEMIARRYLWGEGMEEGWTDFRPDDPLRDDDGNATRDDQCHDISMDGDMKGGATLFDVILGADCIVPKLYPIEPLVEALDELSAPTTVSYLSYEQRHYEHYDPAEEFKRLADLCNLEVEVVPDHEMHPMYPANDIEIWKVTRKGNPCADGIRPMNMGVRKACSALGRRSNHSYLLVGKDS
ncbi:hypothetical protein ACHAW5_007647 [Stephanodiscus triporus]|uniref:Uncharacterized protein n=1 Tax=Stephanodiscus triporus TaxID=2934178 RepID=A0ABD3PEA7_9STRA